MALPGTLSAAGAEWTPATTASGGSSNSWHKRYVRNVTKGVSSLLWGPAPSTNAVKKSQDSPTFESPVHNFRSVLDWSHITYPSKESIPTLDFYVARRSTMTKKSSRSSAGVGGVSGGSSSEKGSHSVLSSSVKAPMLHPKSARTSFQLNPPLILEPRRVSFEPECMSTNESTLQGMGENAAGVSHEGGPHWGGAASIAAASASGVVGESRGRGLRPTRWSVSGSSLTGMSASNSSAPDNIQRLVEALGVITVLPFEIVKTDLYGEVTHRVEFKVTHLLHACFSEVLGIGEILICVTAAFTVAVYRLKDLQLLYDIPIHLAENIWMRYYKRHVRSPPPNLNDSRISALAKAPSKFARRYGLFGVGSYSGLTHIWKIPENSLICILPPPLSPRQSVAGLAFAAVDQIECIMDIASPFQRPETSDTSKRENYLLVFYTDGQCAMWAHSLARGGAAGSAPGFAPGSATGSATGFAQTPSHLLVGTIPPHLQFHYPSIEAPLKSTDAMVLEKLVVWRGPSENLILESVLECGDCVALFVKVDDSDFGFILIHPQSCRVVEPLITFKDLNIPIAIQRPCAICYAVLESHRRVFVVATPGVLRVIELQTSDRGSTLDDNERHLIFDMEFRLHLIATIPVSRKTEFCTAKFDRDFDELLLGLTTGEIVKIDGLSGLVLRP